jgi:hypothetical protein
MPVAPSPQGDGKHAGDNQLEEGTAQQGEGVAARGEQQVPGLVDRQIQTIQPAIVGRVAKALPAINGQDQSERKTPAPLAGGIAESPFPLEDQAAPAASSAPAPRA